MCVAFMKLGRGKLQLDSSQAKTIGIESSRKVTVIV